MSKKNDFITVVKRVKSVLSTITDQQRITLLGQGVRDYGLKRNDAEKILKDNGLTDDQTLNYFDVLKLDIEDIESLNDDKDIKERITKQYNERDRECRNRPGGPGNPLIDQERQLLTEARRALLHQNTRQEHIAYLDSLKPKPKHGDLLFTFATTTSIPQLATLMERNANKATEILYSGDLERCLLGTGFAHATQSVRREFQSDESMGRIAMVAIFRDKIKLKRGSEVRTREDLADLIDDNWNESKKLLYGGFFAFWFKHISQTELADTAKDITKRHPSKKDIGLEKFVQELDPDIEEPKPEVNQSKIDFGTRNAKDKDIIQIEIKNTGRGFLYGDVEIEGSSSGFQISNTEINGWGEVSVALDASSLAARKTHEASLVINTNGKQLKVPISCYVDNPTQQAVQRIATSGFSIAAIALVTRLLIQQFGNSGWLATHLTGVGFIDWTQYWSLTEWFEWPWFGWRVPTLSEPGSGLGFVIALTALGAGIFAYWKFFLKKKV